VHHRPYLEAYLHHLVKSGHHVIYSLPDFDDDSQKREIDFSTATVACYDHVTKAFGVELSHVTKYVEDAWLKAAWLAHEHKHDSKKQVEFSVRNAISVAKWERSWRTSAPFDVEFGAPTIQFLCDHEAILTFSLENTVFYASDGRYAFSVLYVAKAYRATLQRTDIPKLEDCYHRGHCPGSPRRWCGHHPQDPHW